MGLILVGNDRVNGMEVINEYYKNAAPEQRDHAYAIMHWFLIAQTFEYFWEQFDGQYKVLDGVYRLSVKQNTIDDHIRHAARPEKLAEVHRIQTPAWAKIFDNKCKLSVLRNELVHEAKYAGSPIGFSETDENYAAEFRAFNLKLICSVLGIKTEYMQVAPLDNNRYRWDIKNI